MSGKATKRVCPLPLAATAPVALSVGQQLRVSKRVKVAEPSSTSGPLATFTDDLIHALPKASSALKKASKVATTVVVPTATEFTIRQGGNLNPTSQPAATTSKSASAKSGKQFDLLSTEGKLPAQRFYNILVYLTNASDPASVPDQYREFLRTHRQWQHLKAFLRAGVPSLARQSPDKADLALACPACPLPQVNYHPEDVTEDNKYLFAQHISFDGSFQAYRKDKPADEWDTCLTDGRQYFLDIASFKVFFDSEQSKKQKTTKDANCNNHKAADNKWVRFTGAAETGIGSAICARHSCFLAAGTVNMYSGEQFLYADAAFSLVLANARDSGVLSVGFYHDIICHYIIKMWKQWSKLPRSMASVTRKDVEQFLFAIPKFHLAGHTLVCAIQFCLNYLFGVGRLDAKGNERCWSNLNQAASSTCEKGPGARIDAINAVMHQWNWAKTVELAMFILRKWLEARQFAEEQRVAWEDFNSLLSFKLTSTWKTQSTEAEKVDGQWTSPFVMPESLRDMSRLDREPAHSINRASASGKPTDSLASTPGHEDAYSWITRGIELQVTQKQIQLDVRAQGSKTTPSQAKAMAKCRSAILTAVQHHRKDVMKHFPLGEEHLNKPSLPAVDGEPEHLPVLLPSDLSDSSIAQATLPLLMLREKELRRTY
ncbi:hypothetical protein FRC12_018127 [Ceratobasidium sp. 428]|nr:hypothetical protein FRC12_018127 [Ceratobasidium sp. 428]